MSKTSHHDERIAKMTFASVYPHYVTKVEKKGRTKDELHQVIEWLTGYNEKKLQELIEKKVYRSYLYTLLGVSFYTLAIQPMGNWQWWIDICHAVIGKGMG